MPPVKHWGTRHILISYAARKGGDVVKIIG